jgi:hypothetical protein
VTIWGTTTQQSGPASYYQPGFNDQGNWRSPDVVGGRVFLDVAILSKPSSRPVQIQLCAWRWNNGRNFSGGEAARSLGTRVRM